MSLVFLGSLAHEGRIRNIYSIMCTVLTQQGRILLDCGAHVEVILLVGTFLTSTNLPYNIGTHIVSHALKE